MAKNFFDDYLGNFYQQNQGDNLYAQTGSENSSVSQRAAQAGSSARTQTGVPRVPAATKKTRMIGYHDPVMPENSITMKYIEQMGLAEESDNVHAQQDTNGKQAYGKSLTDSVNRGARKIGRQIEYGAKLNADEHLSRTQNPLLDITKKGIETYGKSGAEHQDESAGLLLNAGFRNMRHDAVSDTLTREIDGTANGKDKMGMVSKGFENEFITRPQTAFWSAGSMATEGLRRMAPDGSTDSRAYENAEAERSRLQKKSDAYEDQTMKFKNIWDNDNAENTVNNLSQFFYESLGEKAPYAVLGALRPLLEGKSLASRLLGSTLYGTAQNHSRIRQSTGQTNFSKAITGGALNAGAGELSWLNRKYKPAGDSAWGDIFALVASHIIKNETDKWMGQRNPSDKDTTLD